MRFALQQADRGYLDFLSTRVKGRTLYDRVERGSVGGFRQGADLIVCGRLKASEAPQISP